MSEQRDWCPTQNGTLYGYVPEWRLKDGDKWLRIPVQQSVRGVPPPLSCGGVLTTVGLCGFAQANALAWQFAAFAESEGKEIQVRAAEYEVCYEIKARLLEVNSEDNK